MGKYEIFVYQKGDSDLEGEHNFVNFVKFEFNRLADALQFAETCLECGDPDTIVTIKAKQED